MDELPLGLPPAAGGEPGRELDLTAWLNDPATAARYRSWIYTGTGLAGCWPWLGAISSSGHGKIQVGGRGGPVALAHRFGFQLHYGPLAASAPATVPLVVMHICDEHSCQQPRHWQWAPSGDNTRDYYQRGKLGIASPLNDPRGRQGRAVAIRDAILAAGPWPDPQPVDGASRQQWRQRDAARLDAYRAAAALPIWQEEAGQMRLF